MKEKKQQKQLTIFELCKDVKIKINSAIKERKKVAPLIVDGINLRGKDFEHRFYLYHLDWVDVRKQSELVNGKKIKVYKCYNGVKKKDFRFYKVESLYKYLTDQN